MNQIASASQLRMSFLRWALFVVPTIMLLGTISGLISGSGEHNRWFAELVKPALQPPGWVFGLVWPLLYFMIALGFAMILHARGARGRGIAIGLFLLQLLLNLLWSPIFFGQHKVSTGLIIIILLVPLAIATAVSFGRIRKAAAWLMVPYIAWLCFATFLNFEINRLNPDAESLYVPAVSSHIGN